MNKKPSLAFQSPLWAHRDEIRKWRLERMTWKAIAEKLKADYQIALTLQAVRTFFKKASQRKKMPLGFEPTTSTSTQPAAQKQKPLYYAERENPYDIKD